jgi:flagellar biosynthesis protein FliR
MLFDPLVMDVQVFLLVLARIIALLEVAPLFSSGAIPRIAKVGLSLFTAVVILPWVLQAGYPIPDTGLGYVFLMVGEVILGVIMGFLLVIIYAVFQVAGQFFSLQMGFGASQVFDPLAQVQIPLMGQLLNVVAMFVFVSVGGFQKVFLIGIYRSFEALRAIDLVTQREYLFALIVGGLSRMFEQALIISFPILGTLLLVSVSLGLVAKAAPQLNLLIVGFPFSIGVAFLIMFLTMPFIVEAFSRVIEAGFEQLARLIDHVGVLNE